MNYLKLNLPKNPINNEFVLEFNGDDFWHIYTDVEKVLSKEILECFKLLDLHPAHVVIFSSKNPHRTNGLLHTDLENHLGDWKPVSCAINWELNQTISMIEWHDTSNCVEYWPTTSSLESAYPLNYLQAIRYSIGSVIEEEIELDSKEFPILFRTNKAHSITYKTTDTHRFMASVRFNIDQIESWEKAVSIFSKINIVLN
jgi:hypothetical protein